MGRRWKNSAKERDWTEIGDIQEVQREGVLHVALVAPWSNVAGHWGCSCPNGAKSEQVSKLPLPDDAPTWDLGMVSYDQPQCFHRSPTGACAGYRPCLLAGDLSLGYLLCGHGWDVELHTKLPVFMGPPPGKDSDVSLLSKSHAVPPKYAVTQD